MIILAVSTSAKHPSAAVYMDETNSNTLSCRGVMLLKSDESARPHSVSLCALVDEVLQEAGLTVSDVDEFAVDIGPGSFTGVRIGVSFINALAFSCGKPVISVPSLAALRNLAPSPDGTVCTMIDARNGNGYAAIYENGACVFEPCACIKSEILDRLPNDAVCIGDAFNAEHECSASLVILEALENEHPSAPSAVPLYLRPSQAERMRKE